MERYNFKTIESKWQQYWEKEKSFSSKIDKNLCFEYTDPAFVRHYRFYPVLKRPQSDLGQAIITNEGGRLFSLSIRLVVDYMTLYAFHPDYYGESGINIGSRLVGTAPTTGQVGSGLRNGGIDGVPESAKIGNWEVGSRPPQFFDKIWD